MGFGDLGFRVPLKGSGSRDLGCGIWESRVLSCAVCCAFGGTLNLKP